MGGYPESLIVSEADPGQQSFGDGQVRRFGVTLIKKPALSLARTSCAVQSRNKSGSRMDASAPSRPLELAKLRQFRLPSAIAGGSIGLAHRLPR
jgi:hypothetical protein